MKQFVNWLLRWVLWIPILIAEGPESGDFFVGMAALAVGIGLAPMGGGLIIFFEPGQIWISGGWFAFVCIAWYLLVGFFAYFLLPNNSNYGLWHERGAW